MTSSRWTLRQCALRRNAAIPAPRAIAVRKSRPRREGRQPSVRRLRPRGLSPAARANRMPASSRAAHEIGDAHAPRARNQDRAALAPYRQRCQRTLGQHDAEIGVRRVIDRVARDGGTLRHRPSEGSSARGARAAPRRTPGRARGRRVAPPGARATRERAADAARRGPSRSSGGASSTQQWRSQASRAARTAAGSRRCSGVRK